MGERRSFVQGFPLPRLAHTKGANDIPLQFRQEWHIIAGPVYFLEKKYFNVLARTTNLWVENQ